MGVQIDQSLDSLVDVVGGLDLGEVLLLPQSVEQRAFAKLNHQVEVVAFFVVFVQL